MLKEIFNTRQIPGEHRRRWFTSGSLDLIVWFDDADVAVGFQLCYDKDRAEHAITWRGESGFSHMAVDSGEDHGGFRYKATPILMSDGAIDAGRVLALMEENRYCVPAGIVDFVSAKIKEWIANERPSN